MKNENNKTRIWTQEVEQAPVEPRFQKRMKNNQSTAGEKPKAMDTAKITVVFSVKDRRAVEQIYKAHRSGTTVCGLWPGIISFGDQVTTPGEILEAMLELDPECPNKRELKSLCERAEGHRLESLKNP
jgi:hypothetical protein